MAAVVRGTRPGVDVGSYLSKPRVTGVSPAPSVAAGSRIRIGVQVVIALALRA
jgi:hypothetical protein